MVTPQQRTMLPYRLKVSLSIELIMDEVRWRADNSDIEEMIDLVVRRVPGWEFEVIKLRCILSKYMRKDLARVLVEDLVDDVAAVWLFEREHKFPHGFALVPRREVAHA